jgi:elongation factor P
MISANKIKTGMILSIDGQLVRVISSDYHSSGKMVTPVNTKMKNMKTGALIEKHFKPDEKLEEIHLERRDYEFLYVDGKDYYFMHPETFEQVSLTQEVLGPGSAFLKPNSNVPLFFFEDKPVSAMISESVGLKVTLTAPPQQQETMKSAVLEDGSEILVPQFIKVGDIVKIDIQTNKYLERIKEK